MKWHKAFEGRRVAIEIVFRSETNRRWDLTNKTEGIMDALAKAKVIDDDNVKVVPNLSLRWLGKT
jgi:Holliday junction resolvase RusA-like endonuclease